MPKFLLWFFCTAVPSRLDFLKHIYKSRSLLLLLGMVNGPSKNARLAKFKPNSRGLVVSYFYGGPSRSLGFFFNAKEVSGSQKMYQSRRLAKSRIYHSTPLLLSGKNRTLSLASGPLKFNPSKKVQVLYLYPLSKEFYSFIIGMA